MKKNIRLDKNNNKNKKIKIKQKGGEDIVRASSDLVSSMAALGKSIFTEIYSITNIQNNINNVSRETAIPAVKGPSTFIAPQL